MADKPTQQEIDAAAERLANDAYRNAVIYVTESHRDAIQVDWKREEDRDIIVRAYLADRAARAEREAEDAKPITYARLQSCGFGNETLNGVSILIDGRGGDPVELWVSDEGESGFMATLGQSNRNDQVLITGASYETWGQLRKLCSSIGIELKSEATE